MAPLALASDVGVAKLIYIAYGNCKRYLRVMLA